MVGVDQAPRISVKEVRLFERDVTFRMPFRFGVITATGGPQVYARVRVSAEDGREAWGMAAEMLAPKWFDKNLALSHEDNFQQLYEALSIAAEYYLGFGPSTAFGLYQQVYRDQLAAGQARDLNPLVASFGQALLDRAVLDGLCRLHQVSVFQAVRDNLPGIAVTELTPDLEGFDLASFLRATPPAATLHARHTVGMVDPITVAATPIDDGLPETLEQVVTQYGQRYFKLKVGGDLAADLARLGEIAAVLDGIDEPYHASLDGNEQYGDVAGIAELWHAIAETPKLRRLAQSILFIEQPINRQVALQSDVSDLDRLKPVIIDEADGTIDAFPRAKALGYSGVSSKTCKGLYKSILNAARCRHWNGAAETKRYFMSGEDLTTQAGVSVQQDLALVSILGVGHVERNGHHYVNGMSGVPAGEQAAFLAAHPDLYHRAGDTVRLTIRDGRIALGSLGCAGFAVAAEPDWSSMRQTAGPA